MISQLYLNIFIAATKFPLYKNTESDHVHDYGSENYIYIYIYGRILLIAIGPFRNFFLFSLLDWLSLCLIVISYNCVLYHDHCVL